MRLWLIFALMSSTCASRARPDEGPPISVLPADPGPLDALNRRHARLRQRMRNRGYGEEVGLSRAFVMELRGAAWPLDLQTGKCSTFIALGGGDLRDIGLTLYDGEGEVAATDTVEGEGALLHVCPQADPPTRYRPYHLELRAHEGVGAVMIAHFRSLPGAGEGFDGLFEGVLAPRVPFRDVEEHLARWRTALRARGFETFDPPHLERVAEGGVVRRRVRLEQGRCYVATGRSGEGVADIDLFLFDEAGAEVARDLGPDVEPSIEHCPEQTGAYAVELRAFEGAGAVGVMVVVGPGSNASERGRNEVEDASGNSTARDPELMLEVQVAPLLDRGFDAPVFVSRDAAIVPGEVRTHDVVVGPGCAIIAGAASDDAMDLDLYLAEAGGREVDRDTAVQATPRVRACRSTATVMRVAVKGYGRDGAYALAILRAPEPIRDLRSLRLEEASAAFRLRGYEERERFDVTLGTSETMRRPISVEPGRCVAMAVAGDAGVRDVDLELRDAAGELSVSDSGPTPYAAASRCAAEGREAWMMEVLMRRGAGRVEVVVLDAPAPNGLE